MGAGGAVGTMRRYFKRIVTDSPFGSGVAYLEFEGEIPMRQVERYGERWYDSRTDYHPGLGPGLTDQPPEVLGLTKDDEIVKAEFEEAWDAAATKDH